MRSSVLAFAPFLLASACSPSGGAVSTTSSGMGGSDVTITSTSSTGGANTGGSDEAGGGGVGGLGFGGFGGTGSGGSSGTGDGGSGSDGGDSAAGPTSIKVKVMSYNVLTSAQDVHTHPWASRRPVAIAMWKAEDPDLIGTQETQQDQLKDFDAALPDWDRIGVGAANGKTHGETDAIYYRKARFKVVHSGTFWLSATPDVVGSATFGNTTKREVVWGEFLDKTTGTTLFHFNTHFDNQSQNAREKSAELLIKRIMARTPKAPFVVTGDFNANEKNSATLYLEGKGKLDGQPNPLALIDTFRALHPDDVHAGTYGDFTPGKTKGSKIDYVYMGPTLKATGAAIDHTMINGEFPSDHYPIVGTVKVPIPD